MFRIIRLFLEGKAFPNGFLSGEKHRHHVYDIVNILCEAETLEEMIKIDAEVFFTIFSKLFTGAPLKYLAT
jgi:zona occludens toxin (predicted ATPase)